MRPFRNELKFSLHYSVREMLLARWQRYLVKGSFTNGHAVTTILSQYYDSPDLTFYHEKLEGIGLRNKVRLRAYDTAFRAGATVFLEIKRRINDRVRKDRYKIPAFDPTRHLDPANWTFDDPEMERAFLSLNERHRLRASAQTYYQREVYQGAVESDVRVTFDSNLIGLHPNEKLSTGILRDPSRSLMPDTLVILEVKATHGIPRWVHDGIVAGELQQRPIPKYVTAVEGLRMHHVSRSGVYAWSRN